MIKICKYVKSTDAVHIICVFVLLFKTVIICVFCDCMCLILSTYTTSIRESVVEHPLLRTDNTCYVEASMRYSYISCYDLQII